MYIVFHEFSDLIQIGLEGFLPEKMINLNLLILVMLWIKLLYDDSDSDFDYYVWFSDGVLILNLTCFTAWRPETWRTMSWSSVRLIFKY